MKFFKLAIIVLALMLSLTSAFAFTQTIELTEGYNEVTFTVLPENKSIFNVLTSIDGKYETVETDSTPVMAWDRDAPDFANDLEVFEFDTLYHIKVDEDVTLVVDGELSPSLQATVSFNVPLVEDVERSEPHLEADRDKIDDRDEVSYQLFKVPVKVEGDLVIESVEVVQSFNYELGSPYTTDDIVLMKTTFPLAVSDKTETISFDLLIPADLDSIDSDFDIVEHEFSVVVKTDQGDYTTTVKFTAENGLELDSLEGEAGSHDFECDVDDNDLDCDDETEELPLGTDFDIKLTVANILSLDLEDVEFSVESDNRDVEEDDSSFEEDIDEDDEVVTTVSFEVDSDVEDRDDADITIEVEVIDDNGARHGFRYEFTVEFDEDTERGSSQSDRDNTDRDIDNTNTQTDQNTGNTNQQVPTQNQPQIVVQQGGAASVNGQPTTATYQAEVNEDTFQVVSLALVIIVLLLLIFTIVIAVFRK